MILHFAEHDDGGVALVRIKAGKTNQALAGLQTVCKNINPNFPFTYQFSDEAYSKLYKSEQLVGKLSDLFAILGNCYFMFRFIRTFNFYRTAANKRNRHQENSWCWCWFIIHFTIKRIFKAGNRRMPCCIAYCMVRNE